MQPPNVLGERLLGAPDAAPHPLSSTEEFACTPQIADEKPPQFLGSLALCAKNGRWMVSRQKLRAQRMPQKLSWCNLDRKRFTG
jgi:hypothetical protein